jgi:hypothetical protein
VQVALVWGRHDLATPLAVAEAVAADCGWPLHVIDDCADDPPMERPEAFVRALAAEDLRQRLHGPLILPGSRGFADATELWNGMIDKRPGLVIQPDGPADVVAALAFAREHVLALSVRGGGHNIAGTALAEGGLTLDMSRRRSVVVDPAERTATVEPGCRLADVDRETQRHGLATPLGFFSDVGVAGLTLGGGFGYLTRCFGWTVDNLLEVQIVTADGCVHRASRHENAEMGLLHVGGALNERAADDGAVGNRDARYACGVIGMWDPGDPREEEYRRWVRGAGERLAGFSTGGNYVNFQTADEGDDRIRASYGANYDRLAAIKRHYDPGNLFRSNRNIPPATV